ncbi:MAG: diphosphate--fructose-6-phosphate 1-phosphotransferase [Halobacteriaceae archaeon]
MANLLVAQLGGPTAVINTSLYGVVRAAAESGAVDRVLGARHGATGIVEGDVVDLGRESAATLEGLRETPGAALGSARREVTEPDYGRILDTFESHDVGYCLPIGGNGTMAFAGEIDRRTAAAGLDVATVGVPKTVDNDIAATDHCPGYGSAARYYAVTIREVGRDVLTLPPPVTVFETMGRDTGWLAAATALAGPGEDEPPHLLYLPEHAFDAEGFLDDVKRVYDRMGSVFVAVGEGLRDADGDPVSMDETRRDATGKPLPGGVSERLAGLVTEELGLRARSEKPGLCGRASIAHQSETDRREAQRVGEAAVEYATAGESGVMAALQRSGGREYDCAVEPVPLDEVSGTRTLPGEFVDDAGPGVTDAFHEYARPLAGGPLPEHATLDAVPLQDV